MPTECERNSTLLGAQKVNDHHHRLYHYQPQHSEQLETQQITGMNDSSENIGSMAARSPSNDSMSQSQASITSPTTETTNGLKGSTNSGESKKTSLISPDPTSYVTKARVTRPIPPPPSYNPMQFVQIKPCNLYQTAQEQLKKAEEVKKIKEIKKEEPEEWQNNLDNWKSSRRKRVEHIIDRVVEVKKLELEEHDRSRRKSKTFSEMIEERGERAGGRPRTKLTSLAVYNEDESNDLSDLGIGTSSASGKSSLSEDYDNNSVTSDNAELDKAIHNESNHHKSSIQAREYIGSPGYETSSSTAPASSPDPCEYTYEGAIQDYKQRISRAASGGNYKIGANNNNHNNNNNYNNNNSGNVNGNGECHRSISSKVPPNTLNLADKEQGIESYSPRRGNKIEDRLLSFEVTSPSDHQDGVEKVKVDVPKIDISKRKEIFENQRANSEDKAHQNGINGCTNAAEVAPKVTLRERFKFESSASTDSPALKKEVKRLSGDVSSIRERLQSLEQQKEPSLSSSSSVTVSRTVDIPVPPLKDRLSSLQNAVKKEEIKKPPVALVDARQLEIMKKEEETAKQRMQQSNPPNSVPEQAINESPVTKQLMTAADLDDSGIHTTDDAIENGERPSVQQLLRQQEQEHQLNAAIAALAMEEKQLEEAANAVNQIEAEFDELSSATSVASNATNQPQLPYEMDFSVSATNNLLGAGSSSSSGGNADHFGSGSSGGGGSSDSRSSRDSSYSSSNRSSISQETVVAVDTTAPPISSKLQRKPSNEMVHHRNLLKMFKETFKNDIELDEGIEDAAVAVASPVIEHPNSETSYLDSPMSATAAVAQVFAEKAKNSVRDHNAGASMIPIPRNNVCHNKPPQSPKLSAHTPPRYQTDSPIESPIFQRKPASAFSINGRVEIFNSKTMLDANKSPAQPCKKPYLSHLPNEKCTNAMSSPALVPSSAACQAFEIPTKHIEFHQPLKSAIDGVAEPTTTTPAPIQAPSNANHASKPTVRAVNEPQPQLRMASKITQQQQHQRPEVPQTEIVVCAPPITILNPDELPKPNTVKALSSCFTKDTSSASSSASGVGKRKLTPSMPPPKPLPRTRIPQKTPPQSPTPMKRNFAVNTDIVMTGHVRKDAQLSPPVSAAPPIDDKKLSIISTASSVSSDNSLPKGPFETTAIVHSAPAIDPQECIQSTPEKTSTPKSPTPAMTGPPLIPSRQKPKNLPLNNDHDPLKPNATLTPVIVSPSEMPALIACSPNESSLFKLASAPPSPISSPAVEQPTDEDVAICSNFLSHFVPKAPQCLRKAEAQPVRQATVEEVPCEKLDVRKLPLYDQVPRTEFQEITLDEIQRCDGENVLDASPSSNQQASFKPTSPILAARAAHSKALIETCEKIIAEERAASNQIKSSLSASSSPRATPVLARKSKIPKPIQCCIGSPTDTLPKAALHEAKKSSPPNSSVEITKEDDDDDSKLVGRLHVVETQIKVTTTTPPTSPKSDAKSNKPQESKGVKNTIFDFIKKNFGHHEGVGVAAGSDNVAHNTNLDTASSVDTVKVDEVRTIQNSKFYLPADEMPPPPLPKTPAPVNIEITRKITTDEILDESNSEQAFNQEINDLLDAELNKLSLNSNSAAQS